MWYFRIYGVIWCHNGGGGVVCVFTVGLFLQTATEYQHINIKQWCHRKWHFHCGEIYNGDGAGDILHLWGRGAPHVLIYHVPRPHSPQICLWSGWPFDSQRWVRTISLFVNNRVCCLKQFKGSGPETDKQERGNPEMVGRVVVGVLLYSLTEVVSWGVLSTWQQRLEFLSAFHVEFEVRPRQSFGSHAVRIL